MALLVRRTYPICTSCRRAFSTSTQLHLQPQHTTRETPRVEIPTYPYPPQQWYKQSDRGLYGGLRIRFGNNVGPKSGKRTRRSWAVNVHRKRLWSKVLNRFVQIKLSHRVLRTIEKLGGLDEYLLGDNPGRVKELGLKGWELRWSLFQSPAVKKRFREQREALGMDVLQEEVDRLEAERSAMELQDVLDSDVPVELEVDEPVDPEAVALAGEAPEVAAELAADPVVETAAPAELSTDPPRYPWFRLDRQTRLILTPTGWQRRIPRVPKSKIPPKSEFVQKHLSPQLKAARTILKKHNAAIQEEGLEVLPRKDRLRVMRIAKQALREDAEKSRQVQHEFEAKKTEVEARARRKAKNRAAKEAAAALEKEMKQLNLKNETEN